jgi:hypothetical protein
MGYLEPLWLHLFWGHMNWAYWLQKATMLSLGCHTLFQVGKWNTYIYGCVHIHIWLSCLNLYLWSSSLATISFGKLARRLVFQKQFIFINIHDYWSILYQRQIGSFGAITRITSIVPKREVHLKVAAAGPLAGFSWVLIFSFWAS